MKPWLVLIARVMPGALSYTSWFTWR